MKILEESLQYFFEVVVKTTVSDAGAGKKTMSLQRTTRWKQLKSSIIFMPNRKKKFRENAFIIPTLYYFVCRMGQYLEKKGNATMTNKTYIVLR